MAEYPHDGFQNPAIPPSTTPKEGLDIAPDYTKDSHWLGIKTVFTVARIVTQAKGPLFLYGGTVRNLILGKSTNYPDYDIIGDFDLDDIVKRYPDNFVEKWADVSTVRLKIGSSNYDFTSSKDIKATLEENDITISNLCLSEDGKIIDHIGGLDSLRQRQIKINDAEAKIQKDPSRILRVIRFAVEFGFSIEESTLKAVVLNAPLLKSADYADDLKKVLSLDDNTKMTILRDLSMLGIDRYLDFPQKVNANLMDLLTIEREIRRCAPIKEMVDLFPDSEIFLVGGAVRDIILGKKVKDFDFRVLLPQAEIIAILVGKGYRFTTNIDLKPFEYYVNNRTGSVSILVNGKDIDISFMSTLDVDSQIKDGDVNLSCCVYNASAERIENPEQMQEINDKIIKFCNPDRVKDDPLIVVNALKQISRLPDIIIPEETRTIILDCIPAIVDLIEKKPELKYKIRSLCGNINSAEVYELFKQAGCSLDIFIGMPSKNACLAVSKQTYTSIPVESLTDSDKDKIVNLMKTAYGKHYDPKKTFSSRINSVVFERVNGLIIACCLMDGERVYAAAAVHGHDWIALFADLSKNNYNVWCTVDHTNPRVKALCSVGGLRIENDPVVMRKILCGNGKREQDLEIFENKGTLVFVDKNNPDYQQVLLRS